MAYLVAALAQLCVILLTQMAVAAGWVLASTALLIGLIAAAAMALHALVHHHRLTAVEYDVA